MKRLNPKTRKPFKMGDIRKDTYVFRSYRPVIKKDGTFQESWLRPDKFKLMKQRSITATRNSQIKRSKLIKEGIIKGQKRINPQTGIPFKKGDIREDGKIFSAFSLTVVTGKGYFSESWKNKEAYLKERINNIHRMAVIRSKKRNLEYSVDEEYLRSIYPKDEFCLILNIPLKWGDKSDKSNSPSLDRIDSNQGYIKGNLMWISLKANRMKQNSTNEELIKFSNWIIKKIKVENDQ